MHISELLALDLIYLCRRPWLAEYDSEPIETKSLQMQTRWETNADICNGLSCAVVYFHVIKNQVQQRSCF